MRAEEGRANYPLQLPGTTVRVAISFGVRALQESELPRITIVALALLLVRSTASYAQDTSTTRSAPPWSTQVRYGGGPSLGAPSSDFDGSRPPERWCLRVPDWERRAVWWLTLTLSDTTTFGAGWRRVLGDAPQLTSADTVAPVYDEGRCQRVADVINRELLGWSVGPPPIVLLRVRDRLVAFPSNAWRGHFGYAVQLDQTPRIVGVAAW